TKGFVKQSPTMQAVEKSGIKFRGGDSRPQPGGGGARHRGNRAFTIKASRAGLRRPRARLWLKGARIGEGLYSFLKRSMRRSMTINIEIRQADTGRVRCVEFTSRQMHGDAEFDRVGLRPAGPSIGRGSRGACRPAARSRRPSCR